MAFKFYKASSKISVPPKISYREDFEAISDMAFDNAPNVFLKEEENHIEVERVFGTKVFEPVDARVDSVVSAGANTNVSDDFKTFIFRQDFGESPRYGQLFKWMGSFWIVINTNNFESIPISCVVRRCNNMLRWVNESGGVFMEPCVLDYNISGGTNSKGEFVTLPSGYIKAYCQCNDSTNSIKPNQRFLFGNKQHRECYKVTGNGIRNFINLETDNDESFSLTELTLLADYVNNDTDDILNGVADFFETSFQISTNFNQITQNVGFYTQLLATVKRNGEEVYPDVKWTSMNEKIATIDSDGLLKLVSDGETKIICSLRDNERVFCEIDIEVSSSNVGNSNGYFIVVAPDTTEIPEGEEQFYDCRLYKDGVKQPDGFTFAVSGDIPEENYKFYVHDENTFSVLNIKKYLGKTLNIICKSGENIDIFEIKLKGAW